MPNEGVSERFWPKVDKAGPIPAAQPDLGPCWMWTGAVVGRYGQFNIGQGCRRQAHRVAYELVIGRIPEGLVIDHLCRVAVCVNPTHLEPVTQGENIARGWRDTRSPGLRTRSGAVERELVSGG